MILLLPARVGWRAGRLIGIRRIALVALGAVVGLLVAPTTGAQLRERIRQEWEKRQAAESRDVEEAGTVSPS